MGLPITDLMGKISMDEKSPSEQAEEMLQQSNGVADRWKCWPLAGDLIITPRGIARVLIRRHAVATVQFESDGDIGYLFIGHLPND